MVRVREDMTGWIMIDDDFETKAANGAMIYLGSYSKKENAIIARLQAENKYFGEFAPQKTYLNNIKSISRGNVADDLLR